MIRGEYIIGTGECLHNSFTDAGLAGVLAGAFKNVWPATGLYFGLCQAVPGRAVTLADLFEPTIGVNGYSRQALTRDAIEWPVAGTQSGDPFLESKLHTFVATGAGFNKAITRLFVTPEATAVVGAVWALSAALAAPLTIVPTTPLAQRQFNYRIYGV